MSKKIASKSLDSDTETKIKEAARKIFQEKGFAAARTRDIAEEAQMNLALLNYYFKGKKALFDLIMIETLFGFMQNMIIVFNNQNTSLEKKAEIIAQRYIDLIIKEPNVPFFLISELRNNAKATFKKLPFSGVLMQSVFVDQYKKAAKEGKITEPEPLHFLMNLMGMIVFPFIVSPFVKKVGNLSDKHFEKLMLERKKRIPVWIRATLKVK